jgi:hypothetical protein
MVFEKVLETKNSVWLKFSGKQRLSMRFAPEARCLSHPLETDDTHIVQDEAQPCHPKVGQ